MGQIAWSWELTARSGALSVIGANGVSGREVRSQRSECGHGCSLIVFIIVKRLGLLYAASFYS